MMAGMKILRLLVALAYAALVGGVGASQAIECDVCVYGGTASGVMAAVQAIKMGKTAVVAEFGQRLGGLV